MNAPVQLPEILTRKRRSALIRAAFARWHRRMGLFAAVFVLLLSVSGILLSHAEYFGLHKKRLPDAAASLFYPAEAPHILGAPVGRAWIVWMDGLLYLNGQPLGQSLPVLQGAAETAGLIVVAGRHEILLLSKTGQFIEKLNGATLPGPVDRLAMGADGAILLESGGALYRADADLLNWRAVEPAAAAAVWSSPTSALPAHVRDGTLAQRDGVSLLRFVADLHSGRFMGRFGPFIMDLAALLLMLLAGSGFYLWWRQRAARPKRDYVPPRKSTDL